MGVILLPWCGLADGCFLDLALSYVVVSAVDAVAAALSSFLSDFVLLLPFFLLLVLAAAAIIAIQEYGALLLLWSLVVVGAGARGKSTPK